MIGPHTGTGTRIRIRIRMRMPGYGYRRGIQDTDHILMGSDGDSIMQVIIGWGRIYLCCMLYAAATLLAA